MRTLFFLIQKEFLQIKRNRTLLPLIFVMPVMQMLLLAFAANYEVKNLKLCLVNLDFSPAAQRLIGKFEASPNFVISGNTFSHKAADAALATDAYDLVLEIPAAFERDLVREGKAAVHLTVNAINPQKAGLANAYAAAIIQDFNGEFAAELSQKLPIRPDQSLPQPRINVTWSNWFNPRLDYKTFMVPGILGELASLIVCFLTALNIVRERELGTIEQLNVTPIKKWEFILGKLMPFWIISLIIMTVGLAVGKLVFDIPMEGSLWLVFAYTAAFMPCMLGLGFLISNFAETQQQAMFTAWFILIVFILMCGLFTPTDSMPEWAKWLNTLNPIQRFVSFMRLVLLKGAGFADVKDNFLFVAGYGVVVNLLAVWTYRKRV